MSSVEIRIIYADGRTEQRTLLVGTYVIGRSAGDIVLGDVKVSSRHAKLELVPGALTIVDLGSTNGTIGPDGSRLSSPYRLQLGRAVCIGRCRIELTKVADAGTEAFTDELDSAQHAKLLAPGVFISHASEDAVVALQLARGLHQAGYFSWCYELDSIPGTPHTQQTLRAIERCEALLLLVSPNCLHSHEMTVELTRAQDLNRTVIPLLYRISHEQLMIGRAEWGQRLNSSACLDISNLAGSSDRLLECLRHHRVRKSPISSRTRLTKIGEELSRLRESSRPDAPTLAGGRALLYRQGAARLQDVALAIKQRLERDGLISSLKQDGARSVLRAHLATGWYLADRLLGTHEVTVSFETTGSDLAVELGDPGWNASPVGLLFWLVLFWPIAAIAYRQRRLLYEITLLLVPWN
jgi:TIR domain/FHA domain